MNDAQTKDSKELTTKTKYPVPGYQDSENMWNLIY
jgi:hypothetical protein